MKLSKVLELNNHRFIINSEGDSYHEVLVPHFRDKVASKHIMVYTEIMLVKKIIELMERQEK